MPNDIEGNSMLPNRFSRISTWPEMLGIRGNRSGEAVLNPSCINNIDGGDIEYDDVAIDLPEHPTRPEPVPCSPRRYRTCAPQPVTQCLPNVHTEFSTGDYFRIVPISEAIHLLEHNQPDKDKNRYNAKSYHYNLTDSIFCSKIGFSEDEAIYCKHCGVNLRKQSFETFPVFVGTKENVENSLEYSLSKEKLIKKKVAQLRMNPYAEDGKEFWHPKIKKDLVCPNCINKEYVYCSICGYIYLIKDIEEYDGIKICHKCEEFYIICNDCGKSKLLNQHYGIVDADNNVIELLCAFCKNKYTICRNCGNASKNKDLFVLHGFDYNPNPDKYLCLICNAVEKGIAVHDYSYKPTPTFYSSKNESKTKLYFGIELEIEAPNINESEIEKKAKALPEQFFVKSDSSIEYGFEVVTNPMTFRYMRENSEGFEKILDWRKEGWKSYDTTTCGMHIHLSKDAFTSLQLYKFMKFFYEHQKLICKISQRKDMRSLSRWATFDDNSGSSIIYKAKNKSGGFKRHVAINLSNPYTIEVRVFRGTLNPISFWKNIEFCHALWIFAGNSSIKAISPERFELFIKQHRKDYPNLYNFWFSEIYADFCKGD